MKKFFIVFIVFVLSLSLSSPVQAETDGIKKSSSTVALKIGKWRDVPFNGNDAFTLNGERTVWLAQLHVSCKKAPKYIKMRLARH